MNKIKLSICIPTYNRADCIGSCLDSVLSQMDESVEIVIVDGCSTDQTAEIVDKYVKSFPGIHYFCRDYNVGVDADILKTVETAKGQYCWFLSDDDKLEPGAIKCVLSKLHENPKLVGVSVNMVAYDSEMEYEIRAVPPVSRSRLTHDHLFRTRDEAFTMLGIHFGFLSAQIILREAWLNAVTKTDIDRYSNNWLLVYIIGQMQETLTQWLYVHWKCVGYRSGNDSFKGRLGILNRQRLTHDDFEIIIRDLFGYRTKVYSAIFRTLLHDRMGRSLAVMKADGLSLSLHVSLFKLYFVHYWYYPIFWLKVYPVFFVPNFIFKWLRKVYFRIKSSS